MDSPGMGSGRFHPGDFEARRSGQDREGLLLRKPLAVLPLAAPGSPAA